MMKSGIERIGHGERGYALEALSRNYTPEAKYRMVRCLEEAFSRRMGAKYAVAFCNGTATLHACLEAAGVGPGDEVIVPPLTFISPAYVALQANATPVFADIDPETFVISAESIAERISPRTKAIIVVSLYGLLPDMDPIMALAERHGIKVIEDDAQCFLGTYKGRVAGTIGHMSSFSFQSTKHITSGEGGIVTTDDRQLAERIRKLCSLGMSDVSPEKGPNAEFGVDDPDCDNHDSMGWMYHMSDFSAGVALGQLERIDLLVGARRQAWNLFNEAAGNCGWLRVQRIPAECATAAWTFVAALEHPEVSWYEFRDKYMELGGDGIYSGWKTNYLEPVFRNMALRGRERAISRYGDYSYHAGLCPVSEAVQPKLLQFKTNYWDSETAWLKADALRKTIEFFQ